MNREQAKMVVKAGEQALRDLRRAALMTELAQLDAEDLAAAQAAGPAEHNHVWDYLEGYRAIGVCPRCDQLRTEKAALGETPHNHEKMPYGRMVFGCPRCIELSKGARPRPAVGRRRWS